MYEVEKQEQKAKKNLQNSRHYKNVLCYARATCSYIHPYIDPPTSVPPTIQEFAFMKLPMNAGEFANLQCIVPTGDLPLNIRWSYPGEEMGGSSGVLAKKVADRVSMLMISVITAKHSGEYVCTAENAAGTASHSTTLTVNDRLRGSNKTRGMYVTKCKNANGIINSD